MGLTQSTTTKINFEDMQTVCKNPEVYLLINTLPITEQGCLIRGTIGAENEEKIINQFIRTNKDVHIIFYGRNSNDETPVKKYQQLISLGFTNIYIYTGGLFEWLILQDIYGFEEFPTTSKQLDFLKYKPSPRLNVGLIEYSG